MVVMLMMLPPRPPACIRGIANEQAVQDVQEVGRQERIPALG